MNIQFKKPPWSENAEKAYEKTDTAVRFFWKQDAKWMPAQVWLLVLMLEVLGLGVFGAGLEAADESLLTRLLIMCGGVLVMLLPVPLLGGRRRMVLDENGLRNCWKIGPLPLEKWQYPLEAVVRLGLVMRLGKTSEYVCVRAWVRGRNGRVKVIRLPMTDVEPGARQVLADMQEVLARLRGNTAEMDDGVQREDVTFIPLDAHAAPVPRPAKTPWRLETEAGELRLWCRPCIPLWLYLLSGGATAACIMMVTYATQTLQTHYPGAEEFTFPGGCFLLMQIVGMLGSLFGFLFLIMAVAISFMKERYTLGPGHLTWFTENGHCGQRVELDGCVGLETYACAKNAVTAGPVDLEKVSLGFSSAREYRLAFRDAGGQRLGEFIRLTREEAAWLGSVIQRAWRPGEDVAAVEDAATENPVKPFLTKIAVADGSLEFEKKTLHMPKLVMMLAIIALYVGLLLWADFQFVRLVLHMWPGAGASLEVWGMFGVAMSGFVAVLAGLFCTPVFLYVISMDEAFKVEKYRLDASGFRYAYRTPLPLKRIAVPAQRLVSFRVETESHAMQDTARAWLMLKTAAGRMLLLDTGYLAVKEMENALAEMNRVAEAGNRLLGDARADVLEESRGEGARPIGEPALVAETSQPPVGRWRVAAQEADGVTLEMRRGFTWDGIRFPVFLVVCMGFVGMMLLAGAWASSRFGTDVEPAGARPGDTVLMRVVGGIAICGVLAWCGAMFFGKWKEVKRRHFVRLGRDGVCAGDTLFGKTRQTEVALRSGDMLAVRDSEIFPWQAQQQSFWKRLEKPAYSVVAEHADGESHTLADGLTLEEACWLRGEVLGE